MRIVTCVEYCACRCKCIRDRSFWFVLLWRRGGSLRLQDFLVFFFKQNAAYDVRISDWSSDVCSSDLLYHYFGNKESLYCAVLAEAYQEIRTGERALHLDSYEPEEAMDRLVRFTFRHFLEKPWFISLLTTENLHKAAFLKKLPQIKELHSPLVGQIQTLIERGSAKGVFRANADPVQLYISIAALGYFYLSNRHTLSTIFSSEEHTSELQSLTRI